MGIGRSQERCGGTRKNIGIASKATTEIIGVDARGTGKIGVAVVDAEKSDIPRRRRRAWGAVNPHIPLHRSAAAGVTGRHDMLEIEAGQKRASRDSV